MADAAPLLEIENIETCYGLSQALFGMSLSVRSGEMVAMMGRNGMGKTTTIRSILGLTPARAGAIRFAGQGKTHTLSLHPGAAPGARRPHPFRRAGRPQACLVSHCATRNWPGT